MEFFEKDMEMAKRIALEVEKRGGKVYYVGGYVRDRLLNIENKDIDIEVHGILPHELMEILDGLGERLSMGESFGIFGLKGYTVDIAMPRKEKVRGKGHRDFEMFVDPFIGTEKAAQRRDFTVNALMMDVLTGEIIDHFGGREDLQNKVLRHVSGATFAEDALRVLRGAQFASRFDFAIAEETVEICKTISLSALSKERVEAELKKALLKAEKPSLFFESLRKMGKLSEWFSELEALIGVEQNPKFHAEGDVWNHTMMVLDAAVAFRDESTNPFGFMLTALAHDFGKAVCTEVIDGRICSYQHETKGLPLIDTFLHRITSETKLIGYVLNLSEYHMKPNTLAAQHSSVKATNKMFDAAISPRDLILIAKADHLGRIMTLESPEYDGFLWERLAVFEATMAKPYVMGRDLIQAGLKPNAKFTEILAYAHKLRLAGVDKESALKQTLAYAEKEMK
ncbi:MAG: tRNA nucleotidyltransferase [Clostridia bacterium]|nr:tRNA nucleotidyltransferase [Clostridia bacterium]